MSTLIYKYTLSNGNVWIQQHQSKRYSVVFSPSSPNEEPTVHGDLSISKALEIYSEYLKNDVLEIA